MTGEWRRLHNEELHNLHTSPNIIRVDISKRMRWPAHVAPMGERRNACSILLGKSEWKRPLGRPGNKYKNNIRMDLRERS